MPSLTIVYRILCDFIEFHQLLLQYHCVHISMLSTGRMDPRVGSGHNFAGVWRVGSALRCFSSLLAFF